MGPKRAKPRTLRSNEDGFVGPKRAKPRTLRSHEDGFVGPKRAAFPRKTVYLTGPTGKNNYVWSPKRGLCRIGKDRKWHHVKNPPKVVAQQVLTQGLTINPVQVDKPVKKRSGKKLSGKKLSGKKQSGKKQSGSGKPKKMSSSHAKRQKIMRDLWFGKIKTSGTGKNRKTRKDVLPIRWRTTNGNLKTLFLYKHNGKLPTRVPARVPAGVAMRMVKTGKPGFKATKTGLTKKGIERVKKGGKYVYRKSPKGKKRSNSGKKKPNSGKKKPKKKLSRKKQLAVNKARFNRMYNKNKAANGKAYQRRSV